MTDLRWRTLTIQRCAPASCPHCRMAMGEGVGKEAYLICSVEGRVIKGEGFPSFCPLPIIGATPPPSLATKENTNAPRPPRLDDGLGHREY